VKLNPANFQVEQVLHSLERASQQFPSDSEENASIELAAYALGFLDQDGHLDAFRRYLAQASLPASQVIFVEHEFADMPEAQRWLNTQPPPKRGTLVKVAGRTHTVWTKDGALLLLPSFTPQEVEALASEDEE
jgi:hypothetical protein